MSIYKTLFMQYLNEKGVKYTDVDEFAVKISYSCDNINSVNAYVFFDKKGQGMVQLHVWNIMNYKGKREVGYVACNELNNKYRWVKFYVDNDDDIAADIDAYIDEDTCGPECLNLVRRIVNIVDEAYPTFARYLWGNN
ncbi:MAG: YbjN domain-containing protein [Clostridia bacterium]|nr:YbjN domain-containing protein [Clostridia bacterium]